jgi:hypothetical protein
VKMNEFPSLNISSETDRKQRLSFMLMSVMCIRLVYMNMRFMRLAIMFMGMMDVRMFVQMRANYPLVMVEMGMHFRTYQPDTCKR